MAPDYSEGVQAPRVEEVWLTAFKSYRDAVLPLGDITVLTGRNGSGKSNALDGLEVLSRLASGEELGDALDGRRREGGPVRGGSRGCPPHGESEFQLGCVVADGSHRYSLEVRVQVEPELRVVHEVLTGPGTARSSGVVDYRDLLRTRESTPDSPGLVGNVFNGKPGPNPPLDFRDGRLLTAQLPLRLDPSDPVGQEVIHAADVVTAALRGVFHLDPVPHLMRDYAPERDTDLRRTGENISGALAGLARDEPSFRQLVGLVRDVSDDRVSDVSVERSSLGDVMLAIRERIGGSDEFERTSAREMSDGMLRFIAIATALLTPNRALDVDPGLAPHSATGAVLLVIEELENGLHPSQAGRMLALIKPAAGDLEKQVLVSTHSPALLNVMTGELNRSVLVCYRDRESGFSRVTRLTELPGYAEAMAVGALGDAVARGRLTGPEEPSRDCTEFGRLLGIDLSA